MHQFFTVFRCVEHNYEAAFELACLGKSQDLEELIERSISAGKDHERFGEIREPELAHEEVMELEREIGRDVGIGPLLERQADVQADGFAARVGGALVGGLHDTGASAGTDDETVSG